MKRILFQSYFWAFILIFIVKNNNLAAQNNLVLRESYDIDKIQTIELSLKYEDIKIESIQGQNVILEIDSNNSKLLPEIQLSDKKLLIKQESWDFSRGDRCLLAIYLPANQEINSLKIKNLYGNISLKNINSQNSVEIQSDNSQIEIKALTSDYFALEVGNCPPVKLNNLSVNYFNISGTHADFDLNLLHAPLAQSFIHSKFGKINLSIPKSDNFELQTFSTKSYITNKFTNSKSQSKAFTSYIHNQGGPVIKIQTFEGDITITQ